MKEITVCSSDKLSYSDGFTYADTYGESWDFPDAYSFQNWWYMEGGPKLGDEVEIFLAECEGNEEEN